MLAPTILLAETTKQRKKRLPTPSASPGPEESPNASPTEEEAPDSAKVRLWKAADSSDLAIQLRFLPYGKAASEGVSPFKIESDNYQFTEYAEIPSGPMTMEVSAPNRKAVTLALHLVAKSSSTLLVRSRGIVLTADWIDDTPSSLDMHNEFTVHNLLPSSGDIQIDMGNLLAAHLLSAHSSVRLSGMKRAAYPVTASGVDGSGKNIHWTTEVDFRLCRRATLLIYPDAYGRIRPRVSMT